MAVATRQGYPDRDVTVGSIPYPTGQEDYRSTTDDGAVAIDQVAEAVSIDVGRIYLSNEETGNGSILQSRQESDGQETQTEDVRSHCVSLLTSDCHSGESYIGAVESHAGSDIQHHRKC